MTSTTMQKRPVKRWLSVATAILASSLALSACSGSGDDSTTITYAWIPTAAIAPIFVAEEEGIFEDLGLDVNFIRFDSGPAQFAALESGDIDIADMGTQGFIAGQAQGVNAKAFGIIYDLSGTNQLVAGPDSGINSAQDLRGKKVGAVNNTTAYVGLVKYLRDNGMTLDDINYVQLETQAMLPAFINGDIDAAYAWAPWYNQMVAEGGTKLSSNRELGISGHELFVGRTEWLEDHPTEAAMILEAVNRARKLMEERGADWVAELMASKQSIDPEVTADIYAAGVYPFVNEQVDPNYTYSLLPSPDGTGGLAGSLQVTADQLVETGILKSRFDLNDSVSGTAAETWQREYGNGD